MTHCWVGTLKAIIDIQISNNSEPLKNTTKNNGVKKNESRKTIN